ncbi:MAG: metallophosphoesterase [bacterium]|nr:metallophosphoesterase [bacterium]
MITLGHLSDLHVTDPGRARVGALLSKRLLGWISWKVRRKKLYRRHVAEALIEDLTREAPDHVALTGDLVNIALPSEFEAGAGILRAVGPPEHVSLVPGNHDAYVGMDYQRSWALWSRYLVSDDGEVAAGGPGDAVSSLFSFPEPLPTVRIRGDLALVGVCTAVATGPFLAGGRVGEDQLVRLAATLETLRERGLCRVVLVHHPVVDDRVAWRRRCWDSAALRSVLERVGAELVLHGHNHKSEFNVLETRDGTLPVVGVRSASYAGPNANKTAQYHLYQIEPSCDQGPRRFDVSLRVRGWDEATQAFCDVGAPRVLPLADSLAHLTR